MTSVPVDAEVLPTTAPRRLVAGGVAAVTLSILLVAAALHPAAKGEGTHEQLGLPPCSLKARTGIPCPSCGMTTAFAHAARGQLLASFTVQPLGAVLAIVTAMATWVGLYVLITGAAIGRHLMWLWHSRMLWIIVALVVVGWGYRMWTDMGDYL
jgi:hypothetical protein